MNNILMCRVWDKVDNAYWSEKTIRANAEWLLFPNDNIENVIVERSTGLKDKNGNLIYESDIIKCGNATGVIKFGFYRQADEHFPDSIYGFYIKWEKQYSFRQDFGYWATEERIEIIGNIHETKDNK